MNVNSVSRLLTAMDAGRIMITVIYVVNLNLSYLS